MINDHSSARPTYEYQPTIIESGLLIRRLAIQIAFLKTELKRSWTDFKADPVEFLTQSRRDLSQWFRKLLLTPNALPASMTAIVAVACVVLVVLLIEKKVPPGAQPGSETESPLEIVMLSGAEAPDSRGELRVGKDGPGRVGFQQDKGEGSGPTPQRSRGGGSGGDRNPIPPQVGKLPPPSNIPAAIPITPPVNPPALPVAGIDIDPALWKDLKAPVYGDPRSKSEIPSKGPGEGEGIGTNRGTGVGEGDGGGVGPGTGGNIGGGANQPGCCGVGGASSNDGGRPFVGSEVDQRARLLSKPEPQYTEEARKNAAEGRVVLRAVFSSAGEVIQIRAIRTLPFGLTERAIAAARQIKFVPAMKGGRAVSVHMQLEYNFNLY